MTAETPITMPSTVKKVRFLLRCKSLSDDLTRVRNGMNIFVGTGLKPVPTTADKNIILLLNRKLRLKLLMA